MEHKQFTSVDLNHSPYSNKTFLARIDRFAKRSNNLNIPDTIPENSAAELSEDNLKMEVPQLTTENFRGEDKENISVNLQVKCNESINNSINISIDNSYIRQCERKFLESSNSEDEKRTECDENVNKQFMEVQRKLIYPNDTISTPPSLLRKEISILRNEMAEAHEFHDFEIQVLKEEKLNEADSYNYLELFEKYSALMELYTTLKAEYDEYRKEQEKITQEYQSKTADCLEFLCSQIEASDNSLNFSSASFVSFNGGIKSSTMMEDFSEVEATVVHDATVLATDPLSITNDVVFKTPMQTPLKSAKKLCEEELNSTVKTPVLKEVKEVMVKHRSPTPLHSECNIQLLNLETALYDKVKEVENLEQRLFKVEDLSSVLQNEFERITSIYAKENNNLKESLAKKTEHLNELTQKLFTETISLNPTLRDSLIDISGMKLLVVFIETIMEKCKNIQNEEIAKHNTEKANWEAKRKSELNTIEDLQTQISLKLTELENLKKRCENLEMKLCNAESTILTRDEEILVLKSHVSTVRQTEEDFSLVRETLSELETRLTLTEAEKKVAENRYRELETIIDKLKQEIEANGKLLSELQTRLLSSEEKKADIERENVRLKHLYDLLKDQMAAVENILKSNESEITVHKENLVSAGETILQLKFQLQSVEVEKTNLENQFSELQENNQRLRENIDSVKNQKSISADENILNENDDLKRRILEKEKIMAELKTELELAKEKQMDNFLRIEELTKEIEEVKKENSAFSKTLDTVEDSQKNLANLLSDVIHGSDLPSDRITKLIENLSKSQEPIKTREIKIISSFMEIITKTCKKVQNELVEQYDNKRLEWETQRNVDLNLIMNLQDQIKCHIEKITEDEAKISKINLEKENLMKLLENLRTQMLEAEKIISIGKEEIKTLKSQENALKQIKSDLSAADETIEELRSQLSLVLTEKTEVESRCRQLEENVLSFQNEIDMKETIIKELNEMKVIREKMENENDDLKQQVLETEGVVVLLKRNLEEVEKEQRNRELRIQSLQDEIDLLKKEQEDLMSLSEKLENLEKNNKNLMDILLDIQCNLGLPENTITELLANNFENKKMFSERLNNFIKTQIKNRFSWQETKEVEFDDLKQKYEISEKKLSEAECTIFSREKEIQTIRLDLRQTQEDFTAAKKSLSDLKSQLTLSDSKKVETENKCKALEEIIESLKRKTDASEKLRMELQTHLSFADEKKSEFENDNVCLKELCEVLRVKMTKAEDIVSKLEEEICILKSDKSFRESELLELEYLRKMYEILRIKFLDCEKDLALKEEIQILQTVILNMRHTHEDLVTTKEVLSDKLKFIETEKTKAEKKCCDLEEIVDSIKRETEMKENVLTEFKLENVKLKQSCDALKSQIIEAENVIFTKDKEIGLLKSCKSELMMIKDSLISADETILQLKSQLKSLENEKSEVENQCAKLQERNQNLRVEITAAKNLKSNPLYEKIQIENNDLKKRIIESEKVMAELKNELEFAKEDQMSKVKELIREIGELRKENLDFSHVLKAVEEFQKNLANVLSDAGNYSSLPSDRITKLIIQNSNVPDSEDKQNKIVSDFKKTISKIFEEVQNELVKKFDNKILEWESQKETNLKNFQDQIKQLTEKKIHCEAIIKQTKEDLAAADETILQLKSQLTVIETEKAEVEIRRQKLEEGTLSLQAEIDTKETIIKGLDELKIVWKKIEIENDNLKQQVIESEEVVVRLKNCLEINKEEQSKKEIKIQDLQNEIVLLRKEQEDLIILSGKLESTEKNYKNLLNVLSDIQFHLDMPEDTLTKLLSDNFKNKKIFSEKINSFVRTQTEGLKAENKNLKFGIDNLKEKVKQLTKLIGETANSDLKEALVNLNNSHPHNMSLRSKSKNIDICVRRLDRVEEINYNLTELLTRILSATEFPDLEKVKLCSLRDFPNVMKKVITHFSGLESKMKELKEENAQLDEECETYANIIKDLKKEAAAVWKTNKEKTEALESKVNELNEEKKCLENEKQDLLAKISKFEEESEKLKSSLKTDEPFHSCICGNDSKKINELKRIILVKEQKLLELQDMEDQISSYKSQIDYLKTALEREKKKIGEEREKNRKLQNELNETTKNQKTENKKTDENQILDELRMRGSISGGIVQEFVDKEKMKKLSKDIAILKELCRARYTEIKRLEALNAALRNGTSKNSNQMDSPLRSRGHNTTSKNQVRDFWRTEISGKENGAL